MARINQSKREKDNAWKQVEQKLADGFLADIATSDFTTDQTIDFDS